ncbi:MAG: class I SAM-dependent RNA methyltransferase [Bacteroidia bacterium]|nr:class I SAM-dependent RNA methyltransferase [Bacteroidia bacterium]MCC7532678.1 class I SAM-dependent RNA methyltransferase [Bacteroidia bacterium]
MLATTQQYLEPILMQELQQLGAKNINKHNRAVTFTGNLGTLYRANLCTRTALRILVPFTSFTVRNEKDLYEEIRRMEWENYLDVDGTLAVNTTLSTNLFNHSQYISQKVKDAIVDRFRDKFGRRPSVDIANPHLSINIHIAKNEVKVSFDSSAESLHRRGYRTEQTLAPINEVTAAGMILLTGWDGKGVFIDPMCGSGTLLIEAALYAKNVAPGLFRESFGFMHWKNFDNTLWDKIVTEAQNAIKETETIFIGSDKTFKAIEIARANATRAGLDEDIRLSNKRFEEVKPPQNTTGIVIMNPPYGERLPIEEIGAFYKQIGDKLKKDFEGYTAWIITSNKEALKKFGLAASQRLTLFNGQLECKYYKYELYKGSRQKPKNSAINEQ